MPPRIAFGWTSPHGATFGNLTAYGGFTPNGWVAVLAAVPTVFFAMTGAEITTIAAAESAQPGRAVARMGSAVILRILTFYVLSVFLIVSVAPWNTVRSGESPFTLALDTMHVPWAGTIMTVIILTAVLSCLNSAFYVSSRVLFILADRGDAPQMLVKLNKRRVPVGSVLMGAVAGFLGIIAATEAPQAVFDFLVSSSGALIVYVYMTICVAQITLRLRRERAGEPAPPVIMWLFPWLSYAAIAAMGAVLVAMAFTPGHAAGLQGEPRHAAGGGRRLLHRPSRAPAAQCALAGDLTRTRRRRLASDLIVSGRCWPCRLSAARPLTRVHSLVK